MLTAKALSRKGREGKVIGKSIKKISATFAPLRWKFKAKRPSIHKLLFRRHFADVANPAGPVFSIQLFDVFHGVGDERTMRHDLMALRLGGVQNETGAVIASRKFYAALPWQVVAVKPSHLADQQGLLYERIDVYSITPTHSSLHPHSPRGLRHKVFNREQSSIYHRPRWQYVFRARNARRTAMACAEPQHQHARILLL